MLQDRLSGVPTRASLGSRSLAGCRAVARRCPQTLAGRRCRACGRHLMDPSASRLPTAGPSCASGWSRPGCRHLCTRCGKSGTTSLTADGMCNLYSNRASVDELRSLFSVAAERDRLGPRLPRVRRVLADRADRAAGVRGLLDAGRDVRRRQRVPRHHPLEAAPVHLAGVEELPPRDFLRGFIDVCRLVDNDGRFTA